MRRRCAARIAILGRLVTAAGALLAGPGLLLGGAAADTLVIRGGVLVDPAQPVLSGPGTLVIEDGRIARVAPVSYPTGASGAQELDAAGRFVMPGLADVHAHLRTGTWVLDGDPEPVLRELLGWGITTVLDPALSPAAFDRLRPLVARQPAAYPRVSAARGLFTAPGGWGAPGAFTPTDAAAARAEVRRQKAAGSDIVKIMYDDMRWVTRRPYPVMDARVMQALIAEAHAQGLKVFVHAPVLALAKETLRAGADGLIHGIVSEPVDEEFLALMRRNGASYVSTSVMFEGVAGAGSLTEQLLGRELRDALDRLIVEAMQEEPGEGPRFDNTAYTLDRLGVLEANLIAVSRAGINIAIGTDAGIPGILPGISTRLELDLHARAGLAPAEILRAATVNAAPMLGQPERFGGLRPGMAADLLILDADPRADVGNLGRLWKIVRAGRVLDPAPLSRIGAPAGG